MLTHIRADLADPAFDAELLDKARAAHRAAHDANRRVFAELDTRP